MKMIYHSKKNEPSQSGLIGNMHKKSTLNCYIKFYMNLLSAGKVDAKGGAYKRLVELQERRASIL